MSKRLLTVMLLAVMVAAACGRDSETSAGDTGTSGGQSVTTAGGSGGGSPLDKGAFGDLGVVCAPAAKGKANADGSDPGVTADSIQIGTFADPGFQGSLGLDQELFDTAEAFTKWCNDHGGINGRKIDLKERDSAVLQFQQRVIEACDQGDFFVVGGGAVFDDTGQSDRLACGLPAIPGFTVTPAASESDLQVQPVPIPERPAPVRPVPLPVQAVPRDEERDRRVRRSVQTVATVAKRNKEALLANGANIVYEGTYNANGETSWRPFLEAMHNAGVKGLYWAGEPAKLSSLLAEAASLDISFDWVATDPNNYDPSLLTVGSATDGVYLRAAFYPFLDPAQAKQNPATQQYLDLMKQYKPDGKIAYLGVQGLSAWLLFAKAASECGADLSRDCVWKHARAITEWTGGGLHAEHDLKTGDASDCTTVLEVKGQKFQVAKGFTPNNDIYSCDPKNVVPLTGDYGSGTKCPNPAYATDPKPSTCA